MYDGIDVRPVDSHPEGVRGTDNAQRPGRERVLHARALFVVEAGMIGGRVDAGILENGRRGLGAPSRCRIDERTTATHEAGQKLVLVLVVDNSLHAEVDVRTIESSNQDLRRLETQQRDA